MLLAHLLAVVVTALVLAHAEDVLWRTLRRLLPGELDIEAASPIAADEIEFLPYADTAGMFARVK